MPTKKPELVKLTEQHLSHFHPEPYDAPITGVAMVLEGEPIAIGGYADHGDVVQVFSYTTDKAKRYPVLFYRACCVVMCWIDDLGKPAFAFQDSDHPTAADLMSRVDFVQDDSVWRYRWTYSR